MIKTNKVMCIGSTCVDIILELDFIPKASEDQNLKSQTMRVGGCAYNVASILQQAGAEPLLVTPVGLDGVYGAQTVDAVKRYQASRGLASDGIVGCNTWRSLQENVVGAGKTSTTIN